MTNEKLHLRGTVGDVLTHKQAEVMALVHQGYTTKEIARILNIAPSTVDQRVDGARRKLGASTRAEAARLFLERAPIPERFVYERTSLTASHLSATSTVPPHDELRFEDAMFDERAAWDRGSLWRRPHFAPRDMGKVSRLLAVLVLAVLMLLTGGEGLRFARDLGLMFPS